MGPQRALAHCRALVKQHDPQDYACALFLPTSVQPLKWALGALNVETAHIKTASRRPELCAARMQFWLDALSSADQRVENPVVEALRALLPASPTIKFKLGHFLRARMSDLDKAAYFETGEVEEYAERTYSAILYLLLERAGICDTRLDHVASHIGKAQGLTAFIRGAFPLASSGFEPGLPVSVLARHGLSQQVVRDDGQVWRSDAMQQAVHEIADIAWTHLRKASQHMYEVASDRLAVPMRIFLPMLVTRRYLEALQTVDFDLASRELYKHDRWLPLRLAWQCSRRTAFKID